MKSFLLLSFLFLSCLSFSQGISVKATRQHWAGGVCCATGTNYTVTIIGNFDSTNKTEINYIMLDGNEFMVNQVLSNYNETKVFHYEFGISHDHRQDDILLEKIEIVDHNLIKENYVMVTYNNLELKIPITNIEELFYLAYP